GVAVITLALTLPPPWVYPERGRDECCPYRSRFIPKGERVTFQMVCVLHFCTTCNASSTTCSNGASGTYSSTECSLTTPVETVNALTLGRKPLVSLPINVGRSSKEAPRCARTAR